MTTYKSPADSARTIRTALKAKGWGRAHVSVRSHSYSMGSSIYVEIKDLAVPYSDVVEVAKREQVIHYCEISGEILGGGNQHVDVDFASGVLAPFVALVEAEIAAAGEFARSGILIRYDERQRDWRVDVGGAHAHPCWDVRAAAHQVARLRPVAELLEAPAAEQVIH